MKLTNEVIDEAIRLLRKGWTKGCYAEDEEGNTVTIGSPKACRFCAIGATIRAAAGSESNFIEELDQFAPLLTRALRRLRPNDARIPYYGIADFNDDPDTTLEDVIAVFEEARKDCE